MDGAPMILSPKACKRFAFVHIPKTGGSTILEMVRKHPLLTSLLIDHPKLDPNRHIIAEEQRQHIAPAIWDEAFTFATVRDPFDFAISQFFFHLEAHCPHQTKSKKWAHQPACRIFNAMQLKGVSNVTDLSYKYAFNEWLMIMDRGEFRDVGRLAYSLLAQNRTGITQLSWVTDTSGKMVVQKVVKLGSHEYQRLASCDGLVHELCSKAGTPPPLGSSGIALDFVKRDEFRCKNGSSHANPSRHGSRHYYFTPWSCSIVARHFAADFAAFDYDVAACPM
mmetsp:Transcript_39414/g.104010  ORF Transcript_39414/g.104010 Transcript_39414/m.104010 type:complete len:279 (+) Transcript_39414:126-962(+)